MQHTFRIKELRKELGYSQAELAAIIGIGQSYFSDLENGKYKIDVDMFLDLAKALNVCPCQLVENQSCENCTVSNKKYRKESGKNKRPLHIKQFWIIVVNIYQIFKNYL